jgi:hypothetical protein
MKIGRNDPCPCGSGKKYKFCCLGTRLKNNDTPTVPPRFRFEPGSYGAPGAFLPSIACLEQWKPDAWRYHFVLVKLDFQYIEEGEAVFRATEDLNQAVQAGGSPALGERLAGCLKGLGYVRVEGFNIVNPDVTSDWLTNKN